MKTNNSNSQNSNSRISIDNEEVLYPNQCKEDQGRQGKIADYIMYKVENEYTNIPNAKVAYIETIGGERGALIPTIMALPAGQEEAYIDRFFEVIQGYRNATGLSWAPGPEGSNSFLIPMGHKLLLQAKATRQRLLKKAVQMIWNEFEHPETNGMKFLSADLKPSSDELMRIRAQGLPSVNGKLFHVEPINATVDGKYKEVAKAMYFEIPEGKFAFEVRSKFDDKEICVRSPAHYASLEECAEEATIFLDGWVPYLTHPSNGIYKS